MSTREKITNWGTIFVQFLILGCYCFGGPAAHLGYFQQTFVTKRKWLTDDELGNWIALSQLLPGPASSQVGFSIGLQKGGVVGGYMAFLGFTLPSFLLMFFLAVSSEQIMDASWFQGIVHGLKLLAVAIVADAVRKLYGKFCVNKLTIGCAVFTAVSLLLFPSIWTQFIALGICAVVGIFRLAVAQKRPTSAPRLRWGWLILFGIGLITFPFLREFHPFLELTNKFYQAGSWVYGGGHVVLPLLQEMTAEELTIDQFLTGYAAAQAVPGPMFSFASYLGAMLTPDSPLWGSVIAILAVYVPGFCLVIGFRDAWQQLLTYPKVAGGMMGVKASVVGLLLATWVTPISTSALLHWSDAVWAVIGFALLYSKKIPTWCLVLGFGLLGYFLRG